MKRRDLIKTLTLLPLTGSFPIDSLFALPVAGSSVPYVAGGLPTTMQNKPMPDLHRKAFVMDGHTHVMTRELLKGTDIGQRYTDGTVDLPRA